MALREPGMVNLELNEDAIPCHLAHFTATLSHTNVKDGSAPLTLQTRSSKQVNLWTAPTLVMPRKDGTVHSNLDFRALNKRIERRPIRFCTSWVTHGKVCALATLKAA